MNMSMFIFGESRWPRGGAMGVDATPLIFNYIRFDEIWAIYVNFPEKSNRSGENSVGGHLRGVGGQQPPIKNFAWL